MLLGNNTYSGGTTICACAALQLGDAQPLASIIGDITNEGPVRDRQRQHVGRQLGSPTTAAPPRSSAPPTRGTATHRQQEFRRHGLRGEQQAPAAPTSATKTAASHTVRHARRHRHQHGRQRHHRQRQWRNRLRAKTNAGTADITNRNGGEHRSSPTLPSARVRDHHQQRILADESSASLGTDTATAAQCDHHHQFRRRNRVQRRRAPPATPTSSPHNSGTPISSTRAPAAMPSSPPMRAALPLLTTRPAATRRFITVGTGFVDFSGSLGPNGDGRITAGSIARLRHLLYRRRQHAGRRRQ